MKPISSIVLILFIPFSFLLSSCESGTRKTNHFEDSSYQETKMSLEEQEKFNPLSFLNTKGTYRKNMIGEWVVDGTISNNATIATYKDVVIEITFYSKTNSLLGTEKKTIYEYFPAGKTIRFKLKTYGYQGTKEINWNIVNAIAAN